MGEGKGWERWSSEETEGMRLKARDNEWKSKVKADKRSVICFEKKGKGSRLKCEILAVQFVFVGGTLNDFNDCVKNCIDSPKLLEDPLFSGTSALGIIPSSPFSFSSNYLQFFCPLFIFGLVCLRRVREVCHPS